MRLRTIVTLAAPLALAAFLAGCAQPAAYAPRAPGQMTGYTDRELTPNRYRVTFTGNSVTPRQTVEDYLLLRAAEVSLAAGSRYFVFDTRNTKANQHVTVFDDPFFYRSNMLWGPNFYGPRFHPGYWSFRPRWGYNSFGPPADVVVTTNYEAYAEIVLLKPDQVAKEPRAVDAQAVVDHMPAPQPGQDRTSAAPVNPT